jgi:hypothetical protein
LTQSYVVVAISGTATIVAAVVAFVMLVSMQTIQEWPISGLGIHLGNGDSGGVTRATELSAPAARAATGRSHAVSPGAPQGTTRPTAGAAVPKAPESRAAHHGQANLGGGSAIGGRGDRSRDESTGGPTAAAPDVGSDSPSDTGSAAPAAPTPAENGSGASAGSRSVSNAGDPPSAEAVDTPSGQGRGHGSAAGENSGSEHAAKAQGSPNSASTKSRGHSKSSPSSNGSVPNSTPPPAASGNAVSGNAFGHSPDGPPGQR